MSTLRVRVLAYAGHHAPSCCEMARRGAHLALVRTLRPAARLGHVSTPLSGTRTSGALPRLSQCSRQQPAHLLCGQAGRCNVGLRALLPFNVAWAEARSAWRRCCCAGEDTNRLQTASRQARWRKGRLSAGQRMMLRGRTTHHVSCHEQARHVRERRYAGRMLGSAVGHLSVRETDQARMLCAKGPA